MRSIWVLVNQHHQLRHIIKTTGKRVRTDTSGKNRTVGNRTCRKKVCLQIGRNTSLGKRRYLQLIDIFRIGQAMTNDRRHSNVAESNLCTKSLRLSSQVHNGSRSYRRIMLCQGLYRFIVDTSVTDSLPHGITIHLYSRMGHDRQCCDLLSLDDICHPLPHILLHKPF